ncbi:MAG: tetratricopeptide repeat protein [Deltaproteobacteria bacterium]|nr:tetratricopeptide repeat protein [Deltaproteobacteria bacterium]
MGTAALIRRDFPQAIEDLRKALIANETNLDARNNLGLAYWEMGQKAMARAEFKRVLEQNPKYSDAYVNLGAADLSDGRLTEARAYFEKALQNMEYKTRHRALTNLAQVALRENNLDEARRILYQSIQANPEFCMSHFLLGTVYMRDHNSKAAAGEFAKSIRSTCAGNVEGHYQLGIAYLAAKQYDKARAEFALLIDQFPQTVQAQQAADQLRFVP